MFSHMPLLGCYSLCGPLSLWLPFVTANFLLLCLGILHLELTSNLQLQPTQVSVSSLLHIHGSQFLLIVARSNLSSYLVLSIINVRSHLSFLLQLGSSQPFESCSTVIEEA